MEGTTINRPRRLLHSNAFDICPNFKKFREGQRGGCPCCLQELASRTKCVSAVDFDYKAWPIDRWEGKLPMLDTRGNRAPEGRMNSDAIAQGHLADWPNDPYLQFGAQWELLDNLGVQAKKAWKASRGNNASNCRSTYGCLHPNGRRSLR